MWSRLQVFEVELCIRPTPEETYSQEVNVGRSRRNSMQSLRWASTCLSPQFPFSLTRIIRMLHSRGFEIPFTLSWGSGFEFRSGSLLTQRGFPQCLQTNSRTVPHIMARLLPSVSLPNFFFSYRTAKSSVWVAGFWTDIWSQDLRKGKYCVLYRDVV
jgi:hypothetical protein